GPGAHPKLTGRLSLLRDPAYPPQELDAEDAATFVANQLLQRTGVVFKRTIMREHLGVPWRDVLRVFRRIELQGKVRGGRFVAGFAGEQYALPEAVELLRKVRRKSRAASEEQAMEVDAGDPLNFRGILTPDARISPLRNTKVAV
ncbi:MAG: Lhr family helicase, partial [Thermoplasmatota archaeon]